VHAAQIIQIAAVTVEVGLTGNPERRVASNGVDVTLHRRCADDVSHSWLHQTAVGEDAADDATGYVEIAHPASTVALDAVPDALLHAEVRSVCAGLPDAVEQWVGGLKGTEIFDRIGDSLDVDAAPGEGALAGKVSRTKRKPLFGPKASPCAGTMIGLTPRYGCPSASSADSP
jgi:hypothetical protein